MQKSSDPARLEFIPVEHTDVIIVSSTKYGDAMVIAVILALAVAGFVVYRRRRNSRGQS